jgi:hypothetical protein
LSSAGAVSVGQTVELDVTAAIAGNGVYSFAVNNNSSNAVYYSSKEGTTAPELRIQTISSPALTVKKVGDALDLPKLALSALATSLSERFALH